MTDDYKKRLIEYVTGLLQIEDPRPTDFVPNESGMSDTEYSSSWYREVIEKLGGKYACINGILQSSFNEVYIMYGAYQDNVNENSKGFLIFFVKEAMWYYPVKVSLLNTRGIQFLKFDETSNRVYGVTGNRSTYKGAQDNDCYFAYFNNLFLAYNDELEPEQTYSYKIWEDGSQQFCCRDIVKQGEGSRYLIFGTQFTNLNYPTVIDLEIKVGESNTQVNYTTGSNYLGYAFYGEYDGDTPFFKMIVFDNTTGVETFKQALLSGSSIVYANVSIDSEIKTTQSLFTHPSYVALSDSEIYFVHNSNYDKPNEYTCARSTLYKYNGNNNKITEVYYAEVDHEFESEDNYPLLNVVNDLTDVYVVRHLTDNSDPEYEHTSVKLANVTEHPNLQESNFHLMGGVPFMFARNLYNQRVVLRRQFNMIFIDTFSGFFKDNLGDKTADVNGGQGMFESIREVIGYTGYPYVNYNCLVPRYANVGILTSTATFSRNVYNITKFENTTTSSVEIPAQYGNFYLTTFQRLYGTTGYNLVYNYRALRKNKYEIMHLNFINTINVVDEDTGNLYPYSAVRVNYSTNTGGQTNYDNCKCVKYRINYKDGTSSTNVFSWDTINGYNKKTTFVVYTEKDAESIDLLSADQSAIYLHITGNFEEGKYYQIKQKARVGEKPQSVDLQYSNENVLYNNEQVQVIV